MICRKTKQEDVPRIMEMIDQGKVYFKTQGINQWQKGYPNEETIRQDIKGGKSYLLELEGTIVATACLSFNDEKTYEKIYEGAWLSEDSHGIIHRIAVAQEHKGQGVAGLLLEQLEILCRTEGAKSIKIDTHRDNHTMQRFLEKTGFSYCGIIFLQEGDERIAFEKRLT